MKNAVCARKQPDFFFCFGIDNLSNFAAGKSLGKFGGCVVDNNTFFF